MSEIVPAVSAELVRTCMEKPAMRKRGRKPSGLAGPSRKTLGSSVSKLITEALSVSHNRVGMSLAALKKALAAAGYDVEKNNSRIKLGLKNLVSKGILVQTRGTGASGSFKLSKKPISEPTRSKVKKLSPANTKKILLSRKAKSPKSPKANKKGKKPRTTAASKPARSGEKSRARSKKQQKSPTKSRAGQAKARKSKVAQQKTNSRRVVSRK